MIFKFFLMGNSWTAAYYSMDAEAFGFWLTKYPDLADFEEDIQIDNIDHVVVIPGLVMAQIEEDISGFPVDEFGVYAQTESGVAHELSPFNF